jgi:ATP-dependent exoDNAse (exonuclease V) beta subunit
MSNTDALNRLRALLDHDATLLVEAGAGTGKTALLAGRVVLLLSAGKAPSQIAAITFTELAASELLGRIGEYIEKLIAGNVPKPLQAALPQGLTAAQRENLAAARKKLDELTCTTIHGFCQRLVTPYPVQAGIDPGASVTDEAASDLNYSLQFSDWLRQRLSTEGADDPITEVLLFENDDKLVRSLAEIVNARRDAVAPAVDLAQADFDALQKAIRKYRAWYTKLGLEEPKAAMFDEGFQQLSAHYSGGYTAATSFQALWAYANPPQVAIFKDDLSFYAAPSKKAWQEATRGCGKSGSCADQLAGECRQNIDTVAAAFANLHGKLAELVMARLISAIAEFRQEYQNFKRSSALLDFDDLLVQARDLLRNHPDVRRALSERYRHILVDEFQDTDPVQCEILFFLCAEGGEGEWSQRKLCPGRLFLVADPNQSIYRFRRADVEMYCRVRDIIAKQFPANVLPITANFRSVAPVLQHVNQVFADPLKEIGFAALECTVKEEVPLFAAVACIDVGEPEVTKADERRELEARAVAEICSKLIGTLEVRDPETGKLGPCKAGHIALLSPSGTGLWMYERALEQLGIPIATQAGKGLYRRQEIHDLIAITRVLSSGRDTMALGALLRGPFVGLTEEELLDIVAGLPDGERLTVYTDPELVEHAVAAETLRTLAALKRKAYSTSPFDLLSAAVEELRVRPLLVEHYPAHPERALANVDLFLEMARPYSVVGLRGFAQEMTRRWQEAEQEVEGRCDAAEAAVQIITVHSAKGLEWPVVIPVNMCTGIKGTQGVLYSSRRSTLHCKAGNIEPPSYAMVKEEEAEQRRRENIRLWYVAATRARDLLLLPRHAAKGRGKTWFDLVDHGLTKLAAFVAPAIGMPAPAPVEVRGQSAETFMAEAKRIVEQTLSLKWRQPSRHEEGEERPEVEPADEMVVTAAPAVRGSAIRGTVLHKLFEEVLNDATQDSVEALRLRAAELLGQLGVADHADPAKGPSAAEIASSVRKTLELPEIAKYRPQLVPEFNVYGAAAQNDHGLVCTAGICDAVANGDTKPAAIFDWKSDVAPTIEVQRNHAGQLQEYLKLTGCPVGYVVYVTRQSVQEVRLPSAATA